MPTCCMSRSLEVNFTSSSASLGREPRGELLFTFGKPGLRYFTSARYGFHLKGHASWQRGSQHERVKTRKCARLCAQQDGSNETCCGNDTRDCAHSNNRTAATGHVVATTHATVCHHNDTQRQDGRNRMCRNNDV
ncbi:hypothetical protein NDU88_003930 [Pleurodeles waltl]|uniref:Uncharacterized protein n=1 Tax=Pleurodeles waltl TaxID=8319 RepID=A0AAV7LGM8_PLEWA|nr:hypothetical protein NDU88_003930 [Pleurodeles waltl]